MERIKIKTDERTYNMKTLEKQELKQIYGGGLGVGLLLGAGIVFLIGVIDGYTRPLKCN